MHTGGGVYALNPNQIVYLEYDYVIISIAIYDSEMRAQLHELGVVDSKIMTFMPDSSGIQWSDPRYAMMRNCIQYIKERNIQGAVAELGVYQGDFASRLNYYLPDREIYLFDTFEGFSDKDNNKKDVILCGMDNFKDTSAEAVLNRMPIKEKVHIRKGWFPDTAQDLEEAFCFVSLDADLYAPIYSGLQYFYPRLTKGGYIFIHDFGSYNWSGVKKAVYDFCNQNNVSFVPLLDRCSSAIITK